jgi:hypothetical protein
MNCKTCKSAMPDLLLDPTSAASADARVHLNSCVACQEELASLQSTFALLDMWEAPEPSPYFDQKFAVRLREEQATPPASWFERLQSRLLFNTGRQLRPVLIGSMALVLVLGGGTFAGISSLSPHEEKAEVSATVGDLQILDKNDLAMQQMDQLLQDDDPSDDTSPAPPST